MNVFNEANVISEMDEEERERWTIDNDALADWALQKIGEEEAELERLEALAKAQIEAINARVETARKRTENNTAFLKGRLAEYFESVPHKQNKAKTNESYKLLSGSLVWQYDTKKVAHDDAKLVEWLENNGMTEFVKKEVRWGDFKKTLDLSSQTVATIKETGEVVNGVSFVDEAGSFVVKVSKTTEGK